MKTSVTVLSDRKSLEDLQNLSLGICPYSFEGDTGGDSAAPGSEDGAINLLDVAKIWSLAGARPNEDGEYLEEITNLDWKSIDPEHEEALAEYLVNMLDSTLCQLVVLSNEEEGKFKEIVERERRRLEGVGRLLRWLSETRGSLEPRFVLMVVCERDLDANLLEPMRGLLALGEEDFEYDARFLMLNRLNLSHSKVAFCRNAWPVYISRLLLFIRHTDDYSWIQQTDDKRQLHAWRCYDMQAVPPEDYLQRIQLTAFEAVTGVLMQGQNPGRGGERPDAEVWRMPMSTESLNKPANPIEEPEPEKWREYDAINPTAPYRPGNPPPEDWAAEIEDWKLKIWVRYKERLGIRDPIRESKVAEGGALFDHARDYWEDVSTDVAHLHTRIRFDRDKAACQPIESHFENLESSEVEHQEAFQETIGAAHELKAAQDSCLGLAERLIVALVIACLFSFAGTLLIKGLFLTWSGLNIEDLGGFDTFRAMMWLLGSVVLGTFGAAIGFWLLENWRGTVGAKHFSRSKLRRLRDATWRRYSMIADCFQKHIGFWATDRGSRIHRKTLSIQGRVSEVVDQDLGKAPAPGDDTELEEELDENLSEAEQTRKHLAKIEGFQKLTTIEVDFSEQAHSSWQTVFKAIEADLEKRMREGFEAEWQIFASKLDPVRTGALPVDDVAAFLDRLMRNWSHRVSGALAGFLMTDSSHTAVIEEVLAKQFRDRNIGNVGFRDFLSCQVSDVENLGVGMLVRDSLKDPISELLKGHNVGLRARIEEFADDHSSGHLGTVFEVCQISLDIDKEFERVVARYDHGGRKKAVGKRKKTPAKGGS